MLWNRKRSGEELIYADPHASQPPEKPRQRGPRGLRILAAAAVTTALMVLTASVLTITIQGRGQRYQSALRLLELKQYELAAAELESLDDFRDSAALLAQLESNEKRYAAALDLVDQQRYDDAAAAFRALGDYADSPRWAAFGVPYHRALDLMEQTANGSSQMLRRVLPDEVRLTDEGSQTAILGWEAAAAMLESLGDYEDAPAKIDECYRNAAALKLAEGNVEGAAAYAEKMSEKEAARLLAEIQAAEG